MWRIGVCEVQSWSLFGFSPRFHNGVSTPLSWQQHGRIGCSEAVLRLRNLAATNYSIYSNIIASASLSLCCHSSGLLLRTTHSVPLLPVSLIPPTFLELTGRAMKGHRRKCTHKQWFCYYVYLKDKELSAASSHTLLHPPPETMSTTARVGLGVSQDPRYISVSFMYSRNPRSWTIKCCLPRQALARC